MNSVKVNLKLKSDQKKNQQQQQIYFLFFFSLSFFSLNELKMRRQLAAILFRWFIIL